MDIFSLNGKRLCSLFMRREKECIEYFVYRLLHYCKFCYFCCHFMVWTGMNVQESQREWRCIHFMRPFYSILIWRYGTRGCTLAHDGKPENLEFGPNINSNHGYSLNVHLCNLFGFFLVDNCGRYACNGTRLPIHWCGYC